MAAFLIEDTGLLVLWSASSPDMARAGAALSGCGFALGFPALGVEAIKGVAESDRGSALGVYGAFLDLAMAVTGPLAGLIIGQWGYARIFLYGSAAAARCLVLIFSR